MPNIGGRRDVRRGAEDAWVRRAEPPSRFTNRKSMKSERGRRLQRDASPAFPPSTAWDGGASEPRQSYLISILRHYRTLYTSVDRRRVLFIHIPLSSDGSGARLIELAA